MGATVGLLSASYVFAAFLFAPLGSWTVQDESARRQRAP